MRFECGVDVRREDVEVGVELDVCREFVVGGDHAMREVFRS